MRDDNLYDCVCHPILSDLADMEVTYTDGAVEVIKQVRYQVAPTDLNPIVISGTSLEVENVDGELWTLLGVRKYRLLVPEHD